MDNIVLIMALSAILWYLIDRFKPLWDKQSWGKYVTMACAAIGGFALAFGFNLDIIYASGLVAAPTVLGTVITALTLMSGSSAASEIVERLRHLPEETQEGKKHE